MKIILLCLALLLPNLSNAAECTLYEKSHPTFLLTGSHLSTGKCQTCASCHKGGIYMGTPKSCVTCHSGDPRWTTVGRSIRHLPTLLVECSFCHKTVSFTASVTMNHTAVASLKCSSCHNGAYKSYGAEGKPSDHPKTVTVNKVLITVTAVDCNFSGCHTVRTFSK